MKVKICYAGPGNNWKAKGLIESRWRVIDTGPYQNVFCWKKHENSIDEKTVMDFINNQ